MSFLGGIRKDQSDNHVGSVLENSTFSVIHGKKREIGFVYFVCWK